MTHAEFRALCLSLPGASADFPFDAVTEVFRVRGKMFALCSADQPGCGPAGGRFNANLKCDPGLALDLRAAWAEVVPGWHMNKTHWNTVTVNGALPDDKVDWLVRHSHELVSPGQGQKRKSRSRPPENPPEAGPGR